ncbi:LOW QUALITY PROTEIN: hypothetical protein ACHAW6_000414 [Cyclotella cf. meneghiniana]
MIAKDIVLAYPDYSQGFQIYTDSSKFQLLSFLKTTGPWHFQLQAEHSEQKYSVTKQELLVIVKTLKEFKGMLWGQTITVYMDYKNLMQDVLWITSDQDYCWKLLLEE